MARILTTREERELAFKLRNDVFVDEQNVPVELEIDEKDTLESTTHIGFFLDNKLIATARLTDMDTDYIHVGRVAVDQQFRFKGIGKKIMLDCEKIAKETLKKPFTLELSAQLQAENFYKNLGYTRVNDKIYLDAGIEHVDMKKTIS